VSRSFVQGEDAQDGNGHGTHCAGIAAGPRVPISGPRYGVAGEAQLYIGKVLGNEGGGGDGGVLEGINWAIENNCQVISMSLGSVTTPDQPYSRVFEEVARRAMAAGAVIIAAAGNDSERPDHIAPVAHPANCPSSLGWAPSTSCAVWRIFQWRAGIRRRQGGHCRSGGRCVVRLARAPRL